MKQGWKSPKSCGKKQRKSSRRNSFLRHEVRRNTHQSDAELFNEHILQKALEAQQLSV